MEYLFILNAGLIWLDCDGEFLEPQHVFKLLAPERV